MDLGDQLLEPTGLERWKTCCHFVDDTAKGPDVRLETVDTLIIKKLGCHVVRSSILPLGTVLAVHSFSFLISCRILAIDQIRQLASQTEVAELERAVFIEQHVRWLQVAVNNPIEVQVVQALSEVSTEFLNRLLGQLFVLLDQLEQVSTSAVLENDPQMVPCLVPVVKLENVAILQIVEYSDLVGFQNG